MRSILNTNSLRHLEILEILYMENSRITLGELSGKIKSSEKTLRLDIQFINEHFSPFQIETSQNGVILKYPSNYSTDYIYKKVLYLSTEFSFLEMIFFEENHTIDILAEKLFISTSTLRRIITKINKYFKNSNVNIKILTQPCKLTGNEAAIRNMIIQLFGEKYGVFENPFPTVQVKLLDQILIYIMKKNNVKVDFPELMRLRRWIMVNIVRLRNKHLIPIKEKFPENIDDSVLNNKIYSKLFKVLFQLELTKENAHQLFYLFLNNKYAFSFEHLEKMVDRGENNASFIVPQLKQLLSVLSSKMNIPIRNENGIILELYNLMGFVDRSNNESIGPNYILNNTQRTFLNLESHEFTYFIKILKEELIRSNFHRNFKLSESFFNLILFTIITRWEGLFALLNQSTVKIRAALFCKSSYKHTSWLKGLLEYQFGHQMEIGIINKVTLKSIKKEFQKYDLIITNISELESTRTPVVCINTVPNIIDFEKIHKEIFNLLKDQYSKRFSNNV